VQWIREQALFLLVLLALAAGFGYLLYGQGHWRRSTAIMGGAVLCAGLIRACLPSRLVGMLGVRSRWFDTVVYLALGGAVLAMDIRLHR
jgi:hypothetical protein